MLRDNRQGPARVVVATTVALSFISFWRAAAIVLSDLASSAFYAGGIAEHAIGKSAPWFILGVMLFSFAVRSVYLESCSMFVRGGVYVVVRDAMGRFMARLSVSALIFDYILTGPISVVSAGQYLGRLLNEEYSCAPGVHPGCDTRLREIAHLQHVLRKTNMRRHDIVVMTVRPVMSGDGEFGLQDNQLFADYEKALFTQVVTMAERKGKTVQLLVAPNGLCLDSTEISAGWYHQTVTTRGKTDEKN